MSRLAFDGVVLDIASNGQGYSVSLDGHTYRVESASSADGELDLLVDDRRARAYVTSDGPHRWVTLDGRTFVLTTSSVSRRPAAAHDSSSELSAPMPGQVRAVNVNAGDAVTKGQVLLVLEAMKMEVRLQAPFDGLVSSVDARLGQTVEREQVLIRLERPEASPA